MPGRPHQCSPTEKPARAQRKKPTASTNLLPLTWLRQRGLSSENSDAGGVGDSFCQEYEYALPPCGRVRNGPLGPFLGLFPVFFFLLLLFFFSTFQGGNGRS